MSEKVYDEPTILDRLDSIIEDLEAGEIAYRSDGDDEREVLNYLVMVNLRAARVGLMMSEPAEGRKAYLGTPQWKTAGGR